MSDDKKKGFGAGDIGGLVQAGSAVVNTVDQAISGGYRAREAARQQLKNQMIVNQQAHDFTIVQQREAAKLAQQNAFAFEEAYNTKAAQKRQYEEAGLNPYLAMGMTGGGGGGGGTIGGGSAPGASGGSAAQADVVGAARNNTEAMMAMSQIDLNKALAGKAEKEGIKAEAEAKKTEGVDTQKATAEIGEIAERTENLKVIRVGERLENEMRETRNMITRATANDEIKKVTAELRIMERTYDKMLFEMQKTGAETRILNEQRRQMGERFIAEMAMMQAEIVKAYAASDQLAAQAGFTREEQKFLSDFAEAAKNQGEAAKLSAEMKERMTKLAERMEPFMKAGTIINGVATGMSAGMNAYSTWKGARGATGNWQGWNAGMSNPATSGRSGHQSQGNYDHNWDYLNHF